MKRERKYLGTHRTSAPYGNNARDRHHHHHHDSDESLNTHGNGEVNNNREKRESDSRKGIVRRLSSYFSQYIPFWKDNEQEQRHYEVEEEEELIVEEPLKEGQEPPIHDDHANGTFSSPDDNHRNGDDGDGFGKISLRPQRDQGQTLFNIVEEKEEKKRVADVASHQIIRPSVDRLVVADIAETSRPTSTDIVRDVFLKNRFHGHQGEKLVDSQYNVKLKDSAFQMKLSDNGSRSPAPTRAADSRIISPTPVRLYSRTPTHTPRGMTPTSTPSARTTPRPFTSPLSSTRYSTPSLHASIYPVITPSANGEIGQKRIRDETGPRSQPITPQDFHPAKRLRLTAPTGTPIYYRTPGTPRHDTPLSTRGIRLPATPTAVSTSDSVHHTPKTYTETAKKILETLDQLSSPLLDAKRMRRPLTARLKAAREMKERQRFKEFDDTDTGIPRVTVLKGGTPTSALKKNVPRKRTILERSPSVSSDEEDSYDKPPSASLIFNTTLSVDKKKIEKPAEATSEIKFDTKRPKHSSTMDKRLKSEAREQTHIAEESKVEQKKETQSIFSFSASSTSGTVFSASDYDNNKQTSQFSDLTRETSEKEKEVVQEEHQLPSTGGFSFTGTFGVPTSIGVSKDTGIGKPEDEKEEAEVEQVQEAPKEDQKEEEEETIIFGESSIAPTRKPISSFGTDSNSHVSYGSRKKEQEMEKERERDEQAKIAMEEQRKRLAQIPELPVTSNMTFDFGPSAFLQPPTTVEEEKTGESIAKPEEEKKEEETGTGMFSFGIPQATENDITGKVESVKEDLNEEKKETSESGGFTFGDGKEEKISFSFGQTAEPDEETKELAPPSGFSIAGATSIPFSFGASKTEEEKEEEKKQETKLDQSATDDSGFKFSFGTTPAPAPALVKEEEKEQEKEDIVEAKKEESTTAVLPPATFSFTMPASTPAASVAEIETETETKKEAPKEEAAFSGGFSFGSGGSFSFGGDSQPTKKAETIEFGIPSPFGIGATDDKKTDSKDETKSAEQPTGGMFSFTAGGSQPEEEKTASAISFGATSMNSFSSAPSVNTTPSEKKEEKQQTAGFSFGAPSTVFQFGSGATSTPAPAPAPTADTTPTTPSSSFSFGSAPASSGVFNFGASSSSVSNAPTDGAGGMANDMEDDDMQSSNSGGPASAGTSFSIGGSSGFTFGSTPAPSGVFAFGEKGGSTSATSTTTTQAPSTAFNFGNSTTPTVGTPTTEPGVFSFGGNNTAPSNSGNASGLSASSGGFSFGNTAPASSNAAPGAISGFGNAAPVNAPNTSGFGGGFGSAGFGSSQNLFNASTPSTASTPTTFSSSSSSLEGFGQQQQQQQQQPQQQPQQPPGGRRIVRAKRRR